MTVSCTGFFAPGIDVALIEGLGLPRTVERIHVGFMGCHGAINGLQAADAIVRARPASRVLLCAVELCSLHYCFEWEPSRAVGNAVFADGAAALVIEAGPPAVDDANGSAAADGADGSAAADGADGSAAADGADGSAAADGAAKGWRIAATGSCLIPDSTDEMSWRIGDRGFEMYLSPAVPGRDQGASASVARNVAGRAGCENRERGIVGRASGRAADFECGRGSVGVAPIGNGHCRARFWRRAAICLRRRSCSSSSGFRQPVARGLAWRWDSARG